MSELNNAIAGFIRNQQESIELLLPPPGRRASTPETADG